MGDSPFILKDGVQPTLCRWVFEINFQKTPTSILKSCLLWRLQCLWGTANHDTEPPWSIGAPRHVSLGGQPPASNQFSFCRTKKHMLHLKRSIKNHKKMVPRFIVPNAFADTLVDGFRAWWTRSDHYGGTRDLGILERCGEDFAVSQRIWDHFEDIMIFESLLMFHACDSHS